MNEIIKTPQLNDNLDIDIFKKKYSVNLNGDYARPDILIKILEHENKGIMTLGNFSLILGKQKSMKSTFLSMILASLLTYFPISNKIKSNSMDGKIIHIDTEQSPFFINRFINIACLLSGNKEHPKHFECYYLRPFSPIERLSIIEQLIYETEDLLFISIDGIRDLITDINSPEEATMISTKLMKWTEEKNCHISTVLHMNKADNKARGHVGSELINKAETIISVKKESDGAIIKADDMRMMNFESFKIMLDNYGIPYVSDEIITDNDL